MATRFGAKPDFGNTFVNFQHPSNAPGFQSEKQRFAGTSNGFVNRHARDPGQHSGFVATDHQAATLNDKISFQVEDKNRRDRLLQARISSKQAQLAKQSNAIQEQHL